MKTFRQYIQIWKYPMKIFSLSKRQRFVITSILLSTGFVGVAFLDNQYRTLGIGSLGVITVLLFLWSLRESIRRDMTLLTLVLPFFFTISIGLFWFLLPSSILARVPVVILCGLGIYTLCLTANIYSVASIRTIALMRAARGVGFVLTLLTFFLILDTILSIREQVFVTSLLVMIISFPLYLQGFWSIPLGSKISKDVLTLSGISTLIMGEIALSLYFWPVTVVVGSLFYTVSAYVLLGLGQAKLEGRLFRQTAREYLTLGALVFIGMFFATRWG